MASERLAVAPLVHATRLSTTVFRTGADANDGRRAATIGTSASIATSARLRG